MTTCRDPAPASKGVRHARDISRVKNQNNLKDKKGVRNEKDIRQSQESILVTVHIARGDNRCTTNN